MEVILGWIFDKAEAPRTLHPLLRHSLLSLLAALIVLGLLGVYLEWEASSIQRDLLYEWMIRDAVH